MTESNLKQSLLCTKWNFEIWRNMETLYFWKFVLAGYVKFETMGWRGVVIKVQRCLVKSALWGYWTFNSCLELRCKSCKTRRRVEKQRSAFSDSDASFVLWMERGEPRTPLARISRPNTALRRSHIRGSLIRAVALLAIPLTTPLSPPP